MFPVYTEPGQEISGQGQCKNKGPTAEIKLVYRRNSRYLHKYDTLKEYHVHGTWDPFYPWDPLPKSMGPFCLEWPNCHCFLSPMNCTRWNNE